MRLRTRSRVSVVRKASHRERICWVSGKKSTKLRTHFWPMSFPCKFFYLRLEFMRTYLMKRLICQGNTNNARYKESAISVSFLPQSCSFLPNPALSFPPQTYHPHKPNNKSQPFHTCKTFYFFSARFNYGTNFLSQKHRPQLNSKMKSHNSCKTQLNSTPNKTLRSTQNKLSMWKGSWLWCKCLRIKT